MKRKALALLMAALMIVGLFPVTAHATECDHSAGNFSYTWENADYHYVNCQDCQRVLGHQEHQYVNGMCGCGQPDPNCAHPNKGSYTWSANGCETNCLNCGAHLTEAHVPNPRLYADNGDGTHLVMCERCNSSYATEAHSFTNGKCSKCHADEPNFVCDHSNTEYEITGEGHKLVCRICGEDRSEFTAHSFSPSTCKCSVCGVDCVHTPGVYQSQGEAGHTIFCDKCKGSYVIGAEHQFVNGVCVCGETESCGHDISYTDNHNGTHDVVCLQCNETYQADADCSYNEEGVCTKCQGRCAHDGETTRTYSTTFNKDCITCDICGYEVEYVDHEHVRGECWDNDDGTHFVMCAQCNNNYIDSEPHAYVDGVCACEAIEPPCEHTEERYVKVTQGHVIQCKKCNEILDHEDHTRGEVRQINGLANAETDHGVYCELCGGLYEYEAHDYTSGEPMHCACGKECAHPESSWEYRTNDGQTKHRIKCLVCEQFLTEDYVDHDFENTGMCDCGILCRHENRTTTVISGNFGKHKVNCQVETCGIEFEEPHEAGGEWINYDSKGHHAQLCANEECKFPYFVGDHRYQNGVCLDCESECPYCGEQKVNVPSDDKQFCQLQCKVCHKVFENTEERAHTFNDADKCTVCKFTCKHNAGTYAAPKTGDLNWHDTLCVICDKDRGDERHDFTGDGICDCKWVCGSTQRPHQFGDCTDVTDGHEHTCQSCGVTEATVKTYKPDSSKVNHVIYCGACSRQIKRSEEHTFPEGSNVCALCQYDCKHEANFLSAYERTASKHTWSCSNCDMEFEAGHNFVAGVCTASEDGTKTGCGYQCLHNGEATIAPKDQKNTTYHNKTCHLCNHTMNDRHVFNEFTGECVCGKICGIDFEHTWEECTPLTTGNGHQRVCTKCTETEYAFVKKGECTTTGSKEHAWTCSMCNDAVTYAHKVGAKPRTDAEKHTKHSLYCEDCDTSYTKQLHNFVDGVCAASEDGSKAGCGYTCERHTASGTYNMTDEKHFEVCGICGVSFNGEAHSIDRTSNQCTVCGQDCKHPQMAYHKYADTSRTEEHFEYCGECGEYFHDIAHTFVNGACACGATK